MPRFWVEGIGIWLMLMLAEAVNGTFRRIVLDPRLGDIHGRQIAVCTGSVLILLISAAMLPSLGRQPASRWWQLGGAWLGLGLAFEIGLGRVFGVSWARIAADFDPRQGGLLALGMIVIAVAPRLIARTRRLVAAPRV